MNAKINELIKFLPLIQQMSGINPTIYVWDKEGVVQGLCSSDILPVGFEIGHKLEDKNDKIFEAIRTGKSFYNKVPKEVLGIAFEGSIIPIFDGGEVVGVVTYTFPSDEKEEVRSTATDLIASIENTEKSIAEISSYSNKLSNNMNEINAITEVVNAELKEAIEVVTAIQQNAKLSNILALNASIESARAGDAGKGFSIVASEMKKFASLSGESSDKINKTLMNIVKSITKVKESIEFSSTMTGEQLTAVEELNKVFEEAMNLANKAAEACSSI